MKNSRIYIIIFLLLVSCGEKLIPEPDNLIPKDKMADIIQEMAIINSAKSSSAEVLIKNDIDPTQFVFEKYDVDSLQFVESDRYYVSLPSEYKEIYKIVEKRLETQAKELTRAKRVKDSLALLEKKKEAQEQAKKMELRKDSLP